MKIYNSYYVSELNPNKVLIKTKGKPKIIIENLPSSKHIDTYTHTELFPSLSGYGLATTSPPITVPVFHTDNIKTWSKQELELFMYTVRIRSYPIHQQNKLLYKDGFKQLTIKDQTQNTCIVYDFSCFLSDLKKAVGDHQRFVLRCSDVLKYRKIGIYTSTVENQRTLIAFPRFIMT